VCDTHTHTLVFFFTGTRESMLQHNEHRRRCLKVQDGRHRTHTAETGCSEAQEGQPVVGTFVGGPRETQAEDFGRSHQTSAEDGAGSERGREAGRMFVLPVPVAHEERLETEGRHFQHAQAQKTVQLIPYTTAARYNNMYICNNNAKLFYIICYQLLLSTT